MVEDGIWSEPVREVDLAEHHGESGEHGGQGSLVLHPRQQQVEAEGEGYDDHRQQSEKWGENQGDPLEHEEVDAEKWEVGQDHEDIDPDQGDHHASHLLSGGRADIVWLADL